MTHENPEAVQPGDLVRDLVTGYEGIVTVRTTWLHGCDRVGVVPNELHDGKPGDQECFDEHRVEVVEKQKVAMKAIDSAEVSRFGMGAQVRDTITGFEGIMVGLSIELGGIVAVVIEPTKLEKGEPIKAHVFESTRVEVVEPKPVPQTKAVTSGKKGGPAPRGETVRRRGM